MILNALAAKLKRRAKADFKGRHFEAALIVQAVSWYLRYPLSYRDIEELFLERGVEVDHSTLNRWVLALANSDTRRLLRAWDAITGKPRKHLLAIALLMASASRALAGTSSNGNCEKKGCELTFAR